MPFKPHTNHWSFNGYREKVTKKNLQELIMQGTCISKKCKNDVGDVVEVYGVWLIEHIAVGIYYLYVGNDFTQHGGFRIEEIKH